MLEDRVRICAGKPQIYGTKFQTNNDGELKLYPIENPENVNDRQLAVGLNSLEQSTAELQEQMARENVPTPPDFEQQYAKWLYAADWRVAVDGEAGVSASVAR